MNAQTEHVFGHPMAIPMKILNFFLPMLSFVLTANGLDIDWHYIAIACGSSIAGSLLFGYFRREKTFGAQLYKIAMAMIGGLIVGSAFVHWREITAPAMVGLAYCVSAMLVLIFLRTVVSLFEENARNFTVTMIQRIFNVKLDKEEKKPTAQGYRRTISRPRQGIHISKTPDGTPTVEIKPSAKPDEIRIVEETVIQKPKDKNLER